MRLGDSDINSTRRRRAKTTTAVKRAIDKRIDHRVGHAEEEDPEDVALVDVSEVGERVYDEDELVGRPADDERCDNDRRHTQ